MTDQNREAMHRKEMARSYRNQEGGITIPSEELDGIVKISLGFQPLGIASNFSGGVDKIAMAAYFEPAICTAIVTRNEGGLHFKVDWIRGVQHGIQSVRLFPDILQSSGTNRLQTVNFGPDGTLWVTRYGEPDFFVLTPPEAEGRWTLTDKLTLPTPEVVHSALLSQSTLFTVESSGGPGQWTLKTYRLEGGQFTKVFDPISISDSLFGVGRRRTDDASWLVTDFQYSNTHGIYRVTESEAELIVGEVDGMGITFLSDGSALVTRYGQSYPGAFNGIPGTLIYVPATLFNK